ncbi:MAG: lipoate--protein ligase family protein [Vulcanococcus sp.]
MTWRWIPPITADGATQMALDSWMLQQLSAGGGPMLRLYTWSRPTLSLGVHQTRLEAHWPALVQAGLIDLVRRPSGGRAVLHGGELTYALVMQPPSRRRLEAYGQACRWLQEAFAALGQPLGFGAVAARQAQGRSSCFASGTGADLVHADGSKRIGSAQLWRGPALLQHGSLLLAPDRTLWRRVFAEEPPPLPPLPGVAPLGPTALAPLAALLRGAAERHLCDGPLGDQPLSPLEWQAVDAIRQQRQQALLQEGLGVQDSPPDCIARATCGSAMPSG